MIVEDQQSLIAWLSSPEAYGLVDDPVTRIETHSAIVFLAGGYAYKLKRAVRYDYLDFSTADRRHEACLAEVRLNQRTAPQIYLDVLPVARSATGSWALGGSGQAVDWLVRMVRFDDDQLLDRLAARDTLDIAVMEVLAASVAALHAVAERRRDHGGAEGMSWVIEGNATGFSSEGRGRLDADRCEALTDLSRLALARVMAQLDDRRANGFVRQCHGDLHLRNIVLIDGRPTLFDGVEFNDRIAVIDVLYDLAFLLMDLWRRGLSAHANRLLNSYLTPRDDLSALALFPLLLSARAAVRAKTSITSAGLASDAARSRELVATATSYLELALSFLGPPRPALTAIGGRSGSGKTTLARSLAPGFGPAPGAVVLRSDTLRKALAEAGETERLGEAHYSREASARVYETLTTRARTALTAGHSVIVDAVFLDPFEREQVARAAQQVGVPFTGLWLEAPSEVLMTRVDERVGDASDATRDVVARQLETGEGSIGWLRVDASGSPDEVAARASSLLRAFVPSWP